LSGARKPYWLYRNERDDAALKIQLGLTTPEEALRAVYLEGE